jgi:hypothetical protein
MGNGFVTRVEMFAFIDYLLVFFMRTRIEQRGRVIVVVSDTRDGAVMESGWDIQSISLCSEAEASDMCGEFLSETEALEAAFRRAREFGLM